MRSALLATLAILIGGCGVLQQSSGLIPRWTTAYHQVISDNDRIRLRDWRASFEGGLAAARKAGHGTDIAREGALLDSDAALAGPAIPNGMYRCRGIKLGSSTAGSPDFLETPASTCPLRAGRELQRPPNHTRAHPDNWPGSPRGVLRHRSPA